MSYKTIFSGSAGPFSGIFRPRVAGVVTLRFFAKRLFPRDLCFGLYSVGFRVARLVVRPLSCRLPCRVTRGSAFFLSAFVSRDSWLGFFPVGFRVAWLVARPLFCRLPCRATCGSGFMSLGCCHWAVVIAGATAFATAALVALFIAETRPMDLQSHSYPANRPEIATP